MQKTIIGCKLGLFIVIGLVCSLALIPIVSAENISFTQEDIEHFAPNTMGLAGGKRIVQIGENDYDDIVRASTTVTIWNTMTVDAPLKTYVGAYPGAERIYVSIQKNYTFYRIPDLSWVSTEPSTFTLKSMHKYKLHVNIEMPKEEAFEKAKGGGFTCIIGFEPDTSQGVGGASLQLIPAASIFISMQENTSFKKSVSVDTASIILIGSGGAIIIGGIAFGVIRKRKNDEQLKKYLSKQKRL